jgi:tRNA-2-methylthio-N6-dimethylallyladenosine synthase
MAKQFHLPMQSGSTEILRRMNRKYTAEKFISLAEKIKEKIPGVSLTTDIIVGFPGETEEDFLGTYEAVKRLRFDSIFSFIYSPRKGTPAANMEDATTKEEKTSRMSRLIELQTEISAEINRGFVGKTVLALCDTKSRLENGFYAAKTTGNKTVFFDFDGDINSLYGKNISIRITRTTAAQLYGEYLK